MYKDFLDFIINLTSEVSQIQMSYFRGGNLNAETKSNASDVVTRADKESEEYIVGKITEHYPNHKILGEEGGYRGQEDSDYMWVVDPLDGTTNYSQGLPIFSISIALMYKQQTLVGVVYAPYLNELFFAIEGQGAYVKYGNDQPKKIEVSSKESLDVSVIGTGFPYDKSVNVYNNGDNVERIIPHIRDLRRMGSAAYDLCCVACGMLDGYWELGLNLWDVCAGSLILKEAGGTLINFRQDRRISLICGNKIIVSRMQKYIK